MTRLGSTILAAIFSLLLVGVTAAQAQLTVQSVQTVDVTPSGFSVVWQASEASDPGIAIYSDALGAVDITNQFEVTLFPMKGGDPTASDRVQQADARDALIAAARAKGKSVV